MALNETDTAELDISKQFLPQTESWAEPLWSGLHRGELHIQKCEPCGSFVYPPVEETCPQCTAAYSWHRASGTGRLWSWVTFHRSYYPGYPLASPYTVLMVEIEEGVRMLGSLDADTSVEELQCDMTMKFKPVRLSDDVHIPGFVLLGKERSRLET
ncbi:OB-fold domain-containing protein [Mesorhizobium sp. Root102]|uniref:Zn-ribbon domain-containing OB-fold protein n=1 Tax=Mesorhizobium sp. Root102 TaxID=1736422 RepID=UPI0006FDFA9B|nr:OB-fold domain-containing protein [Mesorhizobium sp. Root102]